MEKLIKRLFSLLMFLIVSNVQASNALEKTDRTQNFDWTRVINAIIMVESEGNPNAKSGNQCGAMQITPILVKECNNILKSRNSNKRYTLADRFNITKSKEMFVLIQSKYNPTNDIEKAIRSWNGGVNYSIKFTQRYFEKVMAAMK